MRQYTYFISDLHLGANYLDNPIDYERRVVKWLHTIKSDAKALYLMGDVLDYWYEYRYVVPRGFTRFFGAIADLVDSGVEVTWFIGNHDIWIFDYLPKELGVKVVDGCETRKIDGKRFFLAHGDGLGNLRPSFRLMRSLFRNKFCQKLFASIHPRWTVRFAHKWSSSSRKAGGYQPIFEGENNEPFVSFARNHLLSDPDVDYFVLGHRHIMLDYQINDKSHLIILGDWINHFSYAKFDGNELRLLKFDDKGCF